ncbi:MAG: TonB-dependent receptor [Rhodothermales bacterium]
MIAGRSLHRYVLSSLQVVVLTAAVFFVTPSAPAWSQSRASLTGFVRDASTGETLILANVTLVRGEIGAATNTTGYYAITGIEPGTYTVVASYIGYSEFRTELTLAAGESRRLDIDLQPAEIGVLEVVVTADRETEEEVRRVGVAQLKTDLVKSLPAVLEPDVFRSLQLLPGVKAASDYSSGLYIRGGSPDQTLILLDRTTVYNPSHFFGFFSTFNPDAVKDVRLYKGGYPAEYGGRLGSVVDIYNKDGNRVGTHGTASLGLLASRAMVEGPYSRGSWMFAVRRSTLEPLLAVLKNQDIDGIPESFYFYDVNGKVNLDVSADDKVSASFYTGRDRLSLPIFDDEAGVDLQYGNFTGSANWTHIFSDKLYSNFTFTSSRYFSTPKFKFGGTEFNRSNKVYDISTKGDFEFRPEGDHAITGGFWAGNFTFRLNDTFDGESTLSERIQSLYASVYVQDEYKPASNWVLRGGLRANYFEGGDYIRLEPRLSIENRPSPQLRLQAGYGRYYQFLTLITSELFSGSDIWLTTDNGVPPAYGDQFVAGIKTSPRSGLNVDLELYYRTMKGLFTLDPFLPDAAGVAYEDLFQFGDGYAYGSEVLLEKQKGKLNGFVGYTLGLTRRRYFGFEGDKWFSPKYDRTHDLNVVGNFDVGRGWRFTGVFNYATGQAYTQPESQFKIVDSPLGSTVRDVIWAPFNESRLPAYHRMDIGASKIGGFLGFADYELQLQLLNVYSRENVWFYFFESQEDNSIKRTTVPQIPVPIPNISFTLKF